MGTVEAFGCVALGCVVIALALLDVAVTALHPAAESQLSARFHRALWFAVRYAARPLPTRARRALLGWTLPLNVAGLVLSWLLALLVGFALLDAPGLAGPRAFARSAGAGAGPGASPWGDALYFSGVCLTSIGFGDLTPRAGLVRAAAVAEGLAGLLVVGVSITYVLAVFPLLPQARVLARTLNEEADGQVDALPLVRRYLAVGAAEPLAQRTGDAADDPDRGAHHAPDPVLRAPGARGVVVPAGADRGAAAGGGAALRAARAGARGAGGGPAGGGAGGEPDRRAADAGGLLAPGGAAAGGRGCGDRGAAGGLRGAGGGAGGGGAARGGTGGAGRAGGVRALPAGHDPYIAAYAANSGYPAEELWGAHPPLRGTTAPLPLTEADADERDDAGA